MPYVDKLIRSNSKQDGNLNDEPEPKKEEPVEAAQARPESPRVEAQPPVAGPLQIIDTTQKKDNKLIQQDEQNISNEQVQNDNQASSPKVADNSAPPVA